MALESRIVRSHRGVASTESLKTEIKKPYSLGMGLFSDIRDGLRLLLADRGRRQRFQS